MKEITKEQIDEFLELLFVANEENFEVTAHNIPHKLPCFDAGIEFKNVQINELLKATKEKKYIEVDSNNIIKLTEIGIRKATVIVRKHRLAERLLLDILNLKEILMEKNACVFEHYLSSVVADRICVLLNHPPDCPHSKPIPRGKCCEKANTEHIKPAVISMEDASLNSTYKVVFTKDFDTKTFLSLKSFGIYPGSIIEIIQKYPEIIIKVENSKVALEKNISSKIFLLPVEDEKE